MSRDMHCWSCCGEHIKLSECTSPEAKLTDRAKARQKAEKCGADSAEQVGAKAADPESLHDPPTSGVSGVAVEQKGEA